MRRVILSGLVILWVLATAAAARDSTTRPIVRPKARVQTDSVPHEGDAADDPAIWVHPAEPEKSLILGTDKRGGLHVYSLAGRDLQLVADGCHPNNVDVLYDFVMAGKTVDLAVAECRAEGHRGLKVWRIDAQTLRLVDVTAGGVIPTFRGAEPYGVCTYHSARTGKSYAFVGNHSGTIEQVQLEESAAGQVTGRAVRQLKLSSQTEGCVADDELGLVYIAEEARGIWRFGAEPDAPAEGKLIARVGQNGLTADVEGLTIYYARGGKGYLIASSQGGNTFNVYQRDGDNAFVLTIDPAAGTIDDVNDTDGIAVTSVPLSPQFPNGALVVQDGSTPRGRQNFKVYAWEDIAGDRLTINTDWRPRRTTAGPTTRPGAG